MSGTYINQKQPFTKKRLFMNIFFAKVAGLHNKEKKSTRDLFLGVVPNVSENFFCETWLLLLNAIYFFVTLTSSAKWYLFLLWLSLQISRANNVSRLLTAVSGNRRQLVDLLLNKWYRQNVPRNQKQSTSSFLYKFCSVKSHKFHMKVSVIKPNLSKAVSPHTSNCT